MRARPLLPSHPLTFGVGALIVGALTLGASREAFANGRYPTAQHVIVGPGAASSTIVVRSTFGILVSDDAGGSFHYLCEDALEYGGTSFDPAVGLDGDGTLAVGLWDGMLRTANNRCASPRVPSLVGQFIADIDTSADGTVVAVATATGFISDQNYVYRSEDSGATFTRLGVGTPAGVQFESLELGRLRDRRVYATANQLSPVRQVFYASNDGGATLVDRTGFPGVSAIASYVAAIDPTNDDTVYVRAIVDGTDGDGGTARVTALLRSDDAGVTWKELVRSHGAMLGFAIDEGGATLFMGGPSDGLQRSKDRGATWTRLSSTKVQALRHHAGILYVVAADEVDHFALARSCDDGATLHPILTFASLGEVASCPSDSKEAKVCPGRLSTLRASFSGGDLPLDRECPTSSSPLDAGPDGGTADAQVDAEDAATVDAVVDVSTETASSDASSSEPTPATNSSSACGCRAGQAASSPALGALLLVALVGSWRRRRPRRGPRPMRVARFDRAHHRSQ